jgi:2-phosphoglycerate kinase
MVVSTAKNNGGLHRFEVCRIVVMIFKQNRTPDWKVLLIGGSSGVGKTVVARELAKYLSLSLLLLDDVRLALQQATSKETHPELHVFLNYQTEQWRNSESIYADWVKVGKAMVKPLNAIINHHINVPDVGAIIIEGDCILPAVSSQFFETKNVCTVFVVEQNEKQLLSNLQSRGRGFNDGDKMEQEGFAHASWLYGQWLAQEANKLELPVINAQPQQTIVERLISIIGVQ